LQGRSPVAPGDRQPPGIKRVLLQGQGFQKDEGFVVRLDRLTQEIPSLPPRQRVSPVDPARAQAIAEERILRPRQLEAQRNRLIEAADRPLQRGGGTLVQQIDALMHPIAGQLIFDPPLILRKRHLPYPKANPDIPLAERCYFLAVNCITCGSGDLRSLNESPEGGIEFDRID